VKKIFDYGIKIKELNIGGISASSGRKKVYKNIYISDNDKNIFCYLIKNNLKIYIQIVPDSKKILLSELLET